MLLNWTILPPLEEKINRGSGSSWSLFFGLCHPWKAGEGSPFHPKHTENWFIPAKNALRRGLPLLCKAGTPTNLWLIFPGIILWVLGTSLTYTLQPAWKKKNPSRSEEHIRQLWWKPQMLTREPGALVVSIYRNSSGAERMEGWAGSAPFQDVLSCLLDHEMLSRRKGRFVWIIMKVEHLQGFVHVWKLLVATWPS